MPPVWVPPTLVAEYRVLPGSWREYFNLRGKPKMSLAETALVADQLSIPLTVINVMERYGWRFLVTCLKLAPQNVCHAAQSR